MNWYVDASTLIALGSLDDLDLLVTLAGETVVPRTVRAEVTAEPTATNLEAFLADHGSGTELPEEVTRRGLDVLGDESVSGDAAMIGAVLAADDPVGIVSDDRRVRATARGLGATVTGTIGVVGRAVMVGRLTETEAKDRLNRLGERGFHMTAGIRRKADALMEEAAEE